MTGRLFELPFPSGHIHALPGTQEKLVDLLAERSKVSRFASAQLPIRLAFFGVFQPR